MCDSTANALGLILVELPCPQFRFEQLVNLLQRAALEFWYEENGKNDGKNRIAAEEPPKSSSKVTRGSEDVGN